MVQIVKCKNCQNSKIGFGHKFIELNFKTTKRCCEHCNNTNQECDYLFFCSEACFQEWLLNDYLKD